MARGNGIPVRLDSAEAEIVEALHKKHQVPKSVMMRRAVRLFLDAVKRDGLEKVLAATSEPATAESKVAEESGSYKVTSGQQKPTKRKVATLAVRTIYRDISLGDAPAGMPCPGGFRPEAWEETVKIEAKKFPSAAFALRVRGESMTGIGINDGDILIFANAEQQEPRAGDVVAAHIDGEVTIKTLIKTNGMITLRAENPAYPNPLITSSSAVQGVMIGKL